MIVTVQPSPEERVVCRVERLRQSLRCDILDSAKEGGMARRLQRLGLGAQLVRLACSRLGPDHHARFLEEVVPAQVRKPGRDPGAECVRVEALLVPEPREFPIKIDLGRHIPVKPFPVGAGASWGAVASPHHRLGSMRRNQIACRPCRA